MSLDVYTNSTENVVLVGSNNYGATDDRSIPLDLPANAFRTRLEKSFATMHTTAIVVKRTPQDNEIRGRQNIREHVGIFRRLFRI